MKYRISNLKIIFFFTWEPCMWEFIFRHINITKSVIGGKVWLSKTDMATKTLPKDILGIISSKKPL